jgi:hypothetical protein
VIISICVAQPNDPSHILNGLFYDYNEALVRYGSLNLDIQEFNIISSLSINDVGNPLKGKYAVTPSAYDPNDDVVYMAAPNNENKTILSIINATTGSLLRTFNSLENYIVSLQYDIFQKQLFAHIETERENVTQVVEIDINTGKLKQILGTISQAKPTHISSYCPICRKYFLIAQQDNHRIYIGVNSTDGGGISWQTPLDFFPTTMKFDYKTFTMYTVYVNQTTDNFLIGILNRTIGGIGKVVATITDDPNIFVTTPSAYDIAQNIFYSLTISTLPFNIGASYVNLNTSDGKVIPMPRNQYNPYAWFVKQFVH